MNDHGSQGSPVDAGSVKVVAITGACGVVGMCLVDKLLSKGYELRVFSRDADSTQKKLAERHPNESIDVGTYGDKNSLLSGVDAVVHLAARNNDQGGDAPDFIRDNCELTLQLARAAEQAGVKRFVFATTTKALSLNAEAYGASKAQAESELNKLSQPSFRISLARMAPVYGPGSRGKVRHLAGLPLGLNKLALTAVRSFLPIVSVERVAKGIVSLLEHDQPLEELCLADPLSRISIHGIFVAIMNAVFVLAVPTILAVPVIVSALAIVLTSKGGVFFVQRRVGFKQKSFNCRKFRSMRAGAPVRGTHEVGTAYVTKVGGVLRKLKLDELPQAINVLFREMNLIGPRPCLEKQSELINERDRYRVFDVRPGITGLGQVSGVDMSEPRRLAIHDHRYAAFRGILLDIKIAIATVLGRGFGDPVGGKNASGTK
jgi:lipopolysaccharide/colanic/teichoic acid biosynthesis glycosyltransferase